MSKTYTSFSQRGVTSIFIVIFAALLFSMIAISFASLMNREQQRASDDELSQSAYDSAMAGVEDAKRVILAARGDGQAADQAREAIDSGQCNTIRAAGLVGGDHSSSEEVVIQSTTGVGGGSELHQAYTCVKVNTNSSDYRVDLDTTMHSKIVPLRAVDEFNRIKISWHQTADGVAEGPCGSNFDDSNMPLCLAEQWGNSAPQLVPALLRAQFITPSEPFRLADLDRSPAGNTVFLYPRSVGAGSIDAGILARHVDEGEHSDRGHRLERALCSASLLIDEGYHCSFDIELESPVRAESEIAMLRLAAYYNTASVSVELYDDDSPVDFAGVQPVVDSTGRTNDLFRRVEARISLAADVTYPEYALDVLGSLCKHFYVTNSSNSATALPHLGNCIP